MIASINILTEAVVLGKPPRLININQATVVLSYLSR